MTQQPRSLLRKFDLNVMQGEKLPYVSLFSGVGGLDLGISRPAFKV